MVLDGTQWFVEVKTNIGWCDCCKLIYKGEKGF